MINYIDYGYCDDYCIQAIRFKSIYPDYETFKSKTGLEIGENLFDLLYFGLACNGFKWETEFEIINKTKYWVNIYYQNYLKFKDLFEKDLIDLMTKSADSKSANFNPQNIDLLSFTETDESFLNAYFKSLGVETDLANKIKPIVDNWYNVNDKFITEISNSLFLGVVENICGSCNITKKGIKNEKNM